MASKMASTLGRVERSWSVSSTRRMKVPPVLRAQSQLKRAVRAPPMWRYPVGDGAKRTRGLVIVVAVGKRRAGAGSRRARGRGLGRERDVDAPRGRRRRRVPAGRGARAV